MWGNMDNRSPPVRALTCDLVVENLASFLPLEDMKSLSLVCSGIKESVRRTKQFSNRTRLRVTQEAIQRGLIVEGVFSPKHVFLELCPLLMLDDGPILEMVEGADSLQLRLQVPPDAFDSVLFSNYMDQLLTTAKKLKSLELSSDILYEVNTSLFSKLEVQEAISRLHSLKIIAAGPEVLPEFLCGVFRQSFIKISTMPLTLKAFHFGNMRRHAVGYLEKSFLSFIPLLIDQTKGTLEELELLDPRIWMLDEMSGITCPNLKRLSISALPIERSLLIVETFLPKQLPLEEVDIDLFEFPRQIVAMILGSSSKLKRISLKADKFIGGALTIDWKLLKGMSELEEFSLVIKGSAFQTPNSPSWKERGEYILRWLPPTLEKITLEGFDYFWRRRHHLEGKNVGKLLSRFSNLTEFNLHRCYGAVTDVGLQSMIRLCPKLTRLRFSHSVRVTNFGITGVRDGMKTGASLDDLKGLTHLMIWHCPNISPEVMVDVLRFKCLRSFGFFRMVGVPKEVLVRAARHNPTLERLRMNTNGFPPVPTIAPAPAPGDLAALREEVTRANPRIRHLTMHERHWITPTTTETEVKFLDVV